MGRSDVRREGRRVADRQDAEGVLDLRRAHALPREGMGALVLSQTATAAHLRANLPFRVPRWVPTGEG